MNSFPAWLSCTLLLVSCASGSGENEVAKERDPPADNDPARGQAGGTATPADRAARQAAVVPTALPARAASKPVPLTQAELEQYRRELPIAVPPRSARLLQGAPRSGVPTTVKLTGHGGVMIARRAEDGSTLQGCVDDAAGAIEFFESPQGTQSTPASETQ